MNFRQAFGDLGRFLTFRGTPEMFDRIGIEHAILGFATTWIVGIARNWDYPDAPDFARMGLGSLAYILLLSLVIFLMAWPISYEKRNYWHVLTCVSMTAAPGLIYGVPVEKFVSIEAAQGANVAFLAVVATWRVGLAIHYLLRGCQNSALAVASILMLPISLVVIGLVQTGRAGYVIEIMGGLNRNRTGPDVAVDDAIATMFCLAWPFGALAALIYVIQFVNSVLNRE